MLRASRWLLALAASLTLWVAAPGSASTAEVDRAGGSAVFPKVPRPVPGGSTEVGHPWRGDFKVGRNSSAPLKALPGNGLPAGLRYDARSQVITVTSAANGGTLRDFDLSSVQIVFGPGVDGFSIEENVIRNGKSDITTGVVDLYTNAPRNVTIRRNDFIGIRPSENTPFAKAMSAWVFPGPNPFQLIENVMVDSPGDQIKFSAMTCERNFVFGGGASPGAHFDGVQLDGLTGPVVIRGNHFNGVAQGDSHGATNAIRLVPFGRELEQHPILVENNVFQGMGWQIEVGPSLIDVTVRNNHQGGWRYGPVNPDSSRVRYYGNRNLHTGEPIPDRNRP